MFLSLLMYPYLFWAGFDTKSWTLPGYTVARASASPRNSTRPFFLVRRWGLGTRLHNVCIPVNGLEELEDGWFSLVSSVYVSYLNYVCYHAVYAKTCFLQQKKCVGIQLGFNSKTSCCLHSNSWVYYYILWLELKLHNPSTKHDCGAFREYMDC